MTKNRRNRSTEAHPARQVSGVALLTLLAVSCGSPTINVVDPFAVLNWSPHDGATCVDQAQAGLRFSVCLNREIDLKSAQSRVGIWLLDDALEPATMQAATVELAAEDPACVVLSGLNLIEAGSFAFVLSPSLKAKDGSLLGHQLLSRFYTKDSSCP